jgi:hemerythrin-like domain-containing protein
VKFVHGHHQAEETVFFPAVEAKTGKELPPSMTTDHHTLIELLEEIAPLEHQQVGACLSLFQLLFNILLLQDQSTLKQKIDHLVDLVIPHLNEEEDSLLPLISQNFTHAEIEVLSQKIVDSFSASQLFWELPPIYLFMESWCVDPACNYRKLETEFREKIPAVIFFLASWTTIPREFV